jgi:hypothetical protein
LAKEPTTMIYFVARLFHWLKPLHITACLDFQRELSCTMFPFKDLTSSLWVNSTFLNKTKGMFYSEIYSFSVSLILLENDDYYWFQNLTSQWKNIWGSVRISSVFSPPPSYHISNQLYHYIVQTMTKDIPQAEVILQT